MSKNVHVRDATSATLGYTAPASSTGPLQAGVALNASWLGGASWPGSPAAAPASSGNYLQVSAPLIDFGNVHLDASHHGDIGVTNESATAASLSLTITGNAGFALDSATHAALYLGPQQTTTAGVIFTPASTGHLNAMLDLAQYAQDGSGVPTGSASVELYGTGFAYAAPILGAATVTLGTARTGAVLSGQMTLANGTMASSYQESLVFAASGPAGMALTKATGTVLAGASALIGVSLDTTSSGNFALAATLDFTSTGAGTSLLADTALGSQTVAIYGMVYQQAAVGLGTTALALGNIHLGGTSAAALGITNTATGVLVDALLATSTATGAGFTAGGPVEVAAGATGMIGVTFTAAAEGVQAGALDVALASHDAALADLALPDAAVSLTGTAFAYAAPLLSATTLDLGATRIGASLAGSLTITNGASSDPYRESLVYALAAAPGLAVANAGATVVAGDVATLNLVLAATASGMQSLTTMLSLTSTGAGTSLLADTALPGQMITLTSAVYQQAAALLGTTTLDFRIVHLGDAVSRSLAVTNASQGALVDTLLAGFGSLSPGFAASGSLSLAAGQSGSLSVALNTATAGVDTGTATLGLASHDAVLADLSLPGPTISLTGTVNNYATALIGAAAGGFGFSSAGTAYALSFGTINLGTAATETLSVTNAVQGPADTLSGSIAALSGGTGFTNAGLGSFSPLAAGQSTTQLSVSLSASLSGTYSEILQLTATGANASGYSGALASQTVTVSASVVGNYNFTGAPQTITAGGGTDYFYAAANTMFAADAIDAGAGLNTLVLTGGGLHNLGAPQSLLGFQTISATEATIGGGQIDTLRHGMNNVTMYVASVAGGSITIYGANNNDVIYLGNGSDTVQIGAKTETVYGGAGTDTYLLSAAFSTAHIQAGTGTNLLNFTGGGAVVMGANFSGSFTSATLSGASGTAYAFTANAQQNLSIVAATGSARITIGAASQTVSGPGLVDVLATTAQAGVLVSNVGAGSVIDITSTGTGILNAAETGVTVKLDKASTLTLSKTGFLTAIGLVAGDKIIAQAAGQTLSSAAGSATLVGYTGYGDLFTGTTIGINKDTITNFGGSDHIDITDFAFGAATTETIKAAGANTSVQIANGSQTLSLSLTGSYSASTLAFGTDGHAGLQISFTGH